MPMQQSPNSIPELWIHIQADQKVANEHRQEVKQSLVHVNERLVHIENSVDAQYVRKDYFEAVFYPVRNVVYGIVATTLFAVLSSIIYLVVKQ